MKTGRVLLLLVMAALWKLGVPTEASAQASPNVQPNPYRAVESWAKLPAGRTFGSASAVDVGPDGSIWVAERCGANTCSGSTLSPILRFDNTGKVLASFGGGMFV